jgi:hypothetical protein
MKISAPKHLVQSFSTRASRLVPKIRGQYRAANVSKTKETLQQPLLPQLQLVLFQQTILYLTLLAKDTETKPKPYHFPAHDTPALSYQCL